MEDNKNRDTVIDGEVVPFENIKPTGTSLTPTVQASGDGKMKNEKPKKLTSKDATLIKKRVKDFIAILKDDPNDMTLLHKISTIGDPASKIAITEIALYEKLMSTIMAENQQESKEGSKDFNLLEMKRHLDMVNPSVIAKIPIRQKVALIFSKMKVPGGDEIMKIIYENRETVGSAIKGIEVALLQNADDLNGQLADLMTVYAGLRKADLALKNEIYFASLIYNEIVDILSVTTDEFEKQNIEAILAKITTQVSSLLTEENMNTQFFAGVGMTNGMILEQQSQIKNLVRQMKNSVAANLGLTIVASSLKQSVETTQKLGSSIADTMKHTSKMLKTTASSINKARVEGYIDIKKLQAAADEIEAMFIEAEQANEKIIKQGLNVTKQLKASTKSLSKRVSHKDITEKGKK